MEGLGDRDSRLLEGAWGGWEEGMEVGLLVWGRETPVVRRRGGRLGLGGNK